MNRQTTDASKNITLAVGKNKHLRILLPFMFCSIAVTLLAVFDVRSCRTETSSVISSSALCTGSIRAATVRMSPSCRFVLFRRVLTVSLRSGSVNHRQVRCTTFQRPSHISPNRRFMLCLSIQNFQSVPTFSFSLNQ